MEIRLCDRNSRKHLRDFTFQQGFKDAHKLDWSQADQNWLLAWREGAVVGVVQMLPAQPIGRIEYLLLDKSLGRWGRARTARALLRAACEIMSMQGISAVAGTVTTEGLKKAMLKRGSKEAGSGTVMLWNTNRG